MKRVSFPSRMKKNLQRYYLVRPGSEKKKAAAPAYWMQDEGGEWVEAARSRNREKHAKDEVLEVAEAEHLTLLDWRKTPYYTPEGNSGWLSREGRFYGCPNYCHDVLAWCVLGMKVPELEKLGWVRVYSETWYVCQTRLSAEQKNWLSLNGHKIFD